MFKKKPSASSAETAKAAPKAPAPSTPSSSSEKHTGATRRIERSVIVRPYLTEKSSTLAEDGRYTFLVRPDAEKVEIARAIAERYGVHPKRVAIIRLPRKYIQYGRTAGFRSGVKKAIVTLRSGETIPFGVRT